MVQEYHDEFLHVVIDCKTGNPELDKAIEKTISGYIYLVIHAVKIGKLGLLIDKIQLICKDFDAMRK